MIRRLALALPLVLLALPVSAQQPDPAQSFMTDWQGKVIAETHVQQSAEALLKAYQSQSVALKQALADLDWWKSYAKGDDEALKAKGDH